MSVNALRLCSRYGRSMSTMTRQVMRPSQSRSVLAMNQPHKISRRHGGGGIYDYDHPMPGYNLKEWRRFMTFWIYGPYIWGFFGACWMIYRLYAMRDLHFLHGVWLWTELYWP